MRQDPHVYFDDVEAGAHCATTDWYGGSSDEDNHGLFPGDEAFALLGFDGDIERYCWDLAGYGSAECDRANAHILQLMEGPPAPAVKWNTCRNFEWQVCAAKGLLSDKQRSRKMRFAFQPNELWLSGNGGWHEFGACGGLHEDSCESDDEPGFGNDDVFFLEVCLLNQVCLNGAQLFELEDYEEFVCDFSPTGFGELRRILLDGPVAGESALSFGSDDDDGDDDGYRLRVPKGAA